MRAAARQSREVGDPAIVREAVRALAPEYQAKMLRAFALYFQLANAAEQHHRIRRRREDEHAGLVTRESLEEAFERLADVPEEELHERLAGISLELVLTAHPTEATRRTLLQAHVRISEMLNVLDDPMLTPREQTAIDDRLAEEITVLWQTDEVRGERPRVIDEIRHGLWFFEESLFDAGEALFAAYRGRFPDAPPPFAFGTWIGGDLDGNPAVDGETIAAALQRSRELALRRYRREIRELAVAIATSRSLIPVSQELDDSLARDERELPLYAREIRHRNTFEPYRRKLSFMWARIDEGEYRKPEELLDDLRVIRRSLAAHAGGRVASGRLAALERRVELFGFHLAKLDVRLHADEVRAPTERTRGVFDAVAAARRRHGPRALDTVIVSATTVGRRRAARARPDRRAGLDRPAAGDDRRPHRGAGRAARAAGRRALRGARRRARRPRRGHGRLLRLGQGRRLPRGALGDLPRAGGAGRGRARGRRGADDLPRPRRQRRARRRADARRDPRPGAERAAGPAQGDRAGRDDLVQVRPAGDGVPQPRVGARGDGAERVPGDRGPHARPGRARAARRAGRAAPRSCTASSSGRRRASSTSSAPSRPSTSWGCWRSARARRGGRRAATTSARCARSRGSSPGRRTARCCRPGTAAAPRSRTPTSTGCGTSTASCRSSARWSTTSR